LITAPVPSQTPFAVPQEVKDISIMRRVIGLI